MSLHNTSTLSALQARLGYTFRDHRLLYRALTHRSGGADHNERLEFLGDAALGLAIGALLYDRGVLDEGRLSYWRSSLVRAETLSEIARELRLGPHLLMSDSEALAGGAERGSILADAVESIIGATFLDGGFDAARGLVERLYAKRLAGLDPSACIKDAKTRLQEWLQARRLALPSYVVTATDGRLHDLAFAVRCKSSVGQADGYGRNKRAAEQQAAESLLKYLEGSGQRAAST